MAPPLDTAWWRVAAQGLLTGALVSFVAGALYSLGGLPSAPLIVLSLLPVAATMAVMMAAMSGLLPVAGFLTARSAAWVRRHTQGGDLEAAVMVAGAPFSENGAHE